MVPTETTSYSTLSPDIPCLSRIPGPGREQQGRGGDGWVPQPHHSFGLNPSASYDEDFNHEPCQRKGHKAHWAVSAGGSPLPCPVPSPWISPAPSPLLTFLPSHWHLPTTQGRNQDWAIPVPTGYLAGTWPATGTSVSANQGFPQTETQSADKDQTVWAADLVQPLPGSVTLGLHCPISGDEGKSSTHILGRGRKTL